MCTPYQGREKPAYAGFLDFIHVLGHNGNMSIARKVAYNVVFNATTKVLSTFLALVSIAFITRYLGPDGFGDYTTALAFFALFGALADMGLNTVSTREISRKNAPEADIMGKVFTLRIALSLGMVCIAPFAIFFLPYTDTIKVAILFSLAAFFFSSSYTVLNGIFQKNLVMDRVGISELVGKVLQVGFIILAIQLDMSMFAILGAFVFFMFFNLVVLFFWSRRFLAFTPSIDVAFWKTFLRQSFPLGVAVIITFFYFKFDTILLSFLQGSEAVGIYGAAYKIIENMTFFPAMIVGLVLPLLSLYIFHDENRFRRVADATAKVFLLLIIPLVIGGVMLSRDIILLIGGEAFEASVFVLQMLLFALGCMFFGHFFHALLVVGNQQKLLMKLLAVCAVFNISLTPKAN
jgi:O-antigen/teichoic acid export membrane protein